MNITQNTENYNTIRFGIDQEDFRQVLTSESLRLAQSGVSVIPCRRETKRPAVQRWKPFQSEIADAETIKSWYRNRTGADALAVICGRVSGGVECLDFDLSGAAYPEWARRVKKANPGLFARLVKAKTQRNGYHAVFRLEPGNDVPKNQKLAMKRVVVNGPGEHEYDGKRYKAKKEGDQYAIYPCLIETRGEGGYFLCPPSPGYEIKKGDMTEIPVISISERALLVETAKAFNEMPPPTAPEIPEHKPTEPTRNKPQDGDHLTPLDDFDQRGNVRQLLANHGWQFTKRHGKTPSGDTTELWTRPGKNPRKGHSAGLIDGRKLTVWSANADPFDAEETYSPCAIYALLECNGDFSEAARQLRRQGYGGGPREEREGRLTTQAERALRNYLQWERGYKRKLRMAVESGDEKARRHLDILTTGTDMEKVSIYREAVNAS